MSRALVALMLAACASPVASEQKDEREPPGWTDPNPLTRRPASVPAPTVYDAECDVRGAVCGCAQKVAHVEYVGDGAYEALLLFPSAGRNTAAMRVRAGDVIPTPRGRARVVRIMPPSRRWAGDEWVQLHFLEPDHPMPTQLMALGLGAQSTVGDSDVKLLRVEGETATVAFEDDTQQSVQAGAIVTVPRTHDGFGVVEVVAPRPGAEIGWLVVKPFAQRE